jgi:hypothetical protein
MVVGLEVEEKKFAEGVQRNHPQRAMKKSELDR